MWIQFSILTLRVLPDSGVGASCRQVPLDVELEPDCGRLRASRHSDRILGRPGKGAVPKPVL